MTMNTKDDGGPAHPVADFVCPNGQVQQGSYGMTLRQWYAGQETISAQDESMSVAWCEILAGEPMPLTGSDGYALAFVIWEATWRAKLKFIRADAMIAEGKKP